ncbi:MAG: hypothetical protein NT154_38895, partial [Verrucomicrobia bacterium]|nr:hypothetical protein [Verrucomicrobiota bacterium]
RLQSVGVHAMISETIFHVWHYFAKDFFRPPHQTPAIVASGNSRFRGGIFKYRMEFSSVTFRVSQVVMAE